MKENINAVETNVLNEDISTTLHIGKPYILSVILDGRAVAWIVGPSVKVMRSTITQTHNAKIKYSRNTNALLLGIIELIGFFVIL